MKLPWSKAATLKHDNKSEVLRLDALLATLRRHGVTVYRDGELVLHMGPSNMPPNPAIDPVIDEKHITMEQALFWSSSAPSAGGKP